MASPPKACLTWITHGRTRRGRDSYTPGTRIDTLHTLHYRHRGSRVASGRSTSSQQLPETLKPHLVHDIQCAILYVMRATHG